MSPGEIAAMVSGSLIVGGAAVKALERLTRGRNGNGHHKAPCADLAATKAQVTTIDKSLAVLTAVTTEGFENVNRRLDELPKRKR